MMGVGKSTIGRLLSKSLEKPFEDLDERVEMRESLKIYEIFDKKGEAYFRSIEESECLKIIKENGKIIALGGGTFINNNLREQIKKTCFSIWLDLAPDKIFERIKKNKNRPLLKNTDSKKDVENIYLNRKKIYALADYKLDCNLKKIEDISSEIEKIYENI